MRRLLLALPFALLPLAVSAAEHNHAHDEHNQHAEHGSLSAHEHGAAQLNVVLDGKTLELQLESPAMNLVGFEHAAKSAADKAKIAAVRSQLQQPQTLFGLSTGDCSLSQQSVQSPHFAESEKAPKHDHDHDSEHSEHSEHSDIDAHYRFHCNAPHALQHLDLGELFTRFPATDKIQVQLIGPNGQQGLELTPAQPTLRF